MNQREKAIRGAFADAQGQCKGNSEAYCERLLEALDGMLGDTQSLCSGTIR